MMNAALAAADCLPRGGKVTVETIGDTRAPSFKVTASGVIARLSADAERALMGEPTGMLDGRSIQPYLTFQLAQGLNASLQVTPTENEVRFSAG